MNATVLFIAPSAYPFGGVAEWLDYLLPGLSNGGWKCELGLVEGRHHAVDNYLARHPSSSVVRIKYSTGSREGRIQALVSAIEKTRPDILAVVNIVDAYEAVRRLRLGRKPSPRVVTTLHGLQSDLMADLESEADVIDSVIATNKLSARMAAQAIHSDERVLYAPYGVPLHDDVETTCRSSGGVLKLLYSGRLEQDQKRIFDLPDLLATLRERGMDARLTLAGGGPDETTLRSRFEAMDLGNQVDFPGVLSPQDLAREYRHHDALIITSVWETGPIVAWEAMSHGLPVLASRYVGSGQEAALEDGVNSLLFRIGDMEAAANAVMKLAQPGMHARLVQGGMNLLHLRYSRQSSISQWVQALNRVRDLPMLGVPKPRSTLLPSGRLDRWLGVKYGERARRALGLTFAHLDPGGEWPHSRHPYQPQEDFLARAMALDGIEP